MPKIRIGTRGSDLALAQAEWVSEALRQRGADTSIRVIKTTGDRVGAVPLAALGLQLGVKGVFTKEIEDALLAGGIDVAVHSLKDLPTQQHPELELGCVPRRADPRDVLVGASSGELAGRPRIGTGSRRRAAQLRAFLPEARIRDIRGNVGTRIRKLRSGRYDAVVLAAAGLERLGRLAEVAEFLSTDRMVPAPGQGALGIQVRAGDRRVLDTVAALHDPAVAAQVEAERAVLREVGGGCDVPLGAHARSDGDSLELLAIAERPSGGLARCRVAGSMEQAADLGSRVASLLRRDGARFS